MVSPRLGESNSQPHLPARPITHIMSVDVEDYFQVEAFAGSITRADWEQFAPRVDTNTRRILELFDEHGVQATFFLVGWVAEKFPSLVREIVARGHEPACHSYWHRTVYSLTPKEFRADTRAARDIIEQAGGARVLGYRAPTWSITKDSLWALDILAEEGFAYDSSIYPIHHDLYGVPHAQRFAYTHELQGGRQLREFPPATVRLARWNLPAAGGGYLRVLPLFYTHWAFRHIEKGHGQPVVVYFHPWEIDPEQPRRPEKLRSRFRHYTNLDKMQERLRALLGRYSFQPFRDLLDSEGTASKQPISAQASRD